MLLAWTITRINTFKLRFSGKDDVTSRLVRGTFWVAISTLISRIFAMISSVIVIRLLGKEGVGELGMVYSSMGMLGVFAGFGLGSAATKYIAEFRMMDPIKTGRIFKLITVTSLATGGAMAFAAVLMSDWLASQTLNRPGLSPLLKAGALMLYFSALADVQQGVLAGFEAFRKSARISLYQGIAAPFVTIPCVWMFDVQGAILALTINAALTLILCMKVVREELGRNRIPLSEPHYLCWKEHAILTDYAMPAMCALLLTSPVTWLTNAMLVNTSGGYGELGLFNAANQWRQVIMFLPSLISSAILPILAQTHGQQDKSDFKRIVGMNFRMILLVALPVTVIMMTLGNPLASILGNQFIGAGPMITILMATSFLNVVNGTVGTALTAAGKMWIGTVMNLLWASALVLFSLVMIPSYGGRGLALSYLFAYLFHSVLQMAYVDIKLAPKTIQRQWRLILFSGVLLAASSWTGINEFFSYGSGLSLFVLSALPLGYVFGASWRGDASVISGTVNSTASESHR